MDRKRGSAGDQFGSQLVYGLLGGLADDRVLEVAGAEIDVATAKPIPVAAAAEQRKPGAAGHALALGRGENLRRIDVDDPGVNGHIGFGVGVADAADAKAVPVAATAADILLVGLIAELGDAPQDDVIDAQDLSDAGGSCGVGAVGVGEVLLGQNLIQSGALDHGVGTALDKVRDEEVGYPLSNVDIISEHGCRGGLHGGIVEVENGHARLAAGTALCARFDSNRGDSKCRQHGGQDGNSLVFHRSSSQERLGFPEEIASHQGPRLRLRRWQRL